MLSSVINSTAIIFKHSGIICSFSRKPHNMSLRHGDTPGTLENRKDFLSLIGAPYRDLVCAKQVHASGVYLANSKDRGRGALAYETAIADTDALITSQKGLPLGIFTADCLSVFMYEPQASVVAMVHAGWRSTKESICQKTIEKMRGEFNIDPAKLLIGFGPSIKSCCYEVGKEFVRHFDHGLIKKENKYFLDLTGINKKQLIDSGVNQDAIYDSKICTACPDSGYFSFRRDAADCGRMISVIMLK